MSNPLFRFCDKFKPIIDYAEEKIGPLSSEQKNFIAFSCGVLGFDAVVYSLWVTKNKKAKDNFKYFVGILSNKMQEG